MALEEYIGKIVVGVESKRRYVLTKVTSPTIHVRTVEVNSSGYPSHYEKGFPITVPADVWDAVYVAGAAEKDGEMVTSGGRVLGVTAVADTLEDAVRIAYERADRVEFENAYCRRDIGARALAASK